MNGRRKRPHVAEENRKRVARACSVCRKVKAKCIGGIPCARCIRLDRPCKVADELDHLAQKSPETSSQSETNGFFNKDRIGLLEAIVRHFFGDHELSKASLPRIAHTLPAYTLTNKTLSSANQIVAEDRCQNLETDFTPSCLESLDLINATNANVLSHREFSENLQQRLAQQDQTPAKKDLPNCIDSSRASRVRTRCSVLRAALTLLPLPDVASFLIDIFFEYAQTNYSYISEDFLREKADTIYLDPDVLSDKDASIVCTVLMVFAIATQFAHLSSRKERRRPATRVELGHDGMASANDESALALYHAAVTLIPDVLASASVEGARALLLLGVFTLPIDAAGLSFVYLGMSIKIAIQNTMHLAPQKNMKQEDFELRNKIWWSAYTLEKRVCVLHGRPVSIRRSEVTANLPKAFSNIRLSSRVDTAPNILAMIRLTTFLEEARDAITSIVSSNANTNDLDLASILKFRRNLQEYWHTLPTQTHCRDLSTTGPLFRFNTHLALTYHLVHVFIGRNFIFARLDRNFQWNEFRDSIISSCIESSIDIITLCQNLQETIGLARASYTEFTSCRTALLTILAQRTQRSTTQLKIVSEQGIELLKKTSLGFWSADAEKSQLTAMEAAVTRLEQVNHGEGSHGTLLSEAAYDFDDSRRKWDSLWLTEASDTAALESFDAQNVVENPHVFGTFSDITDWMSLPEFDWDTYFPLSSSDWAEDLESESLQP